MEIHVTPLSKSEAIIISNWHYAAPYDFYDFRRDPDDLAELLDPQKRADHYYAAHDEAGALIGFFQFTQAGDTVTIGLGLRPDLTGQGFGLTFLHTGLDFARQHFAPQQFTLAVATFNRRAIRVYEHSGFRPVRIFTHATNGGSYEFIEMARSAESMS